MNASRHNLPDAVPERERQFIERETRLPQAHGGVRPLPEGGASHER